MREPLVARRWHPMPGRSSSLLLQGLIRLMWIADTGWAYHLRSYDMLQGDVFDGIWPCPDVCLATANGIIQLRLLERPTMKQLAGFLSRLNVRDCWLIFFGPSRSVVPGHPWDEKGLQRQEGVGLPVGIQKRRVLFVPVINQLSTVGQPRVNRWFWFSADLHRNSFVRACTTLSEAYQACRGVGVLVCIQSASRNEKRISSCWFPDMPCISKVYRDKKASVHWSAARNTERFSFLNTN